MTGIFAGGGVSPSLFSYGKEGERIDTEQVRK